VLFESLLLATLTSLAGPSPALGRAALAPTMGAYLLAVQAPWLRLTPLAATSLEAMRLESSEACTHHPPEPPSPCLAALASPIAVALPALMRRRRGPTVPRSTMGGTLGGVKSFDVMDSDHVSAGPQLSWLTPDSPREDLLRLRVVAPGWAVRYTWEEAHVSVGVAAFTRFVMFGEDMPVVDMLTSEARIEIELP
jgi:hypothetical protein